MSTKSAPDKIEAIKRILKALHAGESVEKLKREFGDVLSQVSPFEIPLIEQQLVREGIKIDEILRLCDLHVELFREHLRSRELEGVPRGHPLDLLIRENEWIVRQADALSLHAFAILQAGSDEEARGALAGLKQAALELAKIRLHYRKIQMLLFPYLERRGIVAVPRVMWGREDQVRVKLRGLLDAIGKLETEFNRSRVNEVANRALEIAHETSDLVFRENKILFPAVWALLTEGEWAAVAEIAEDLGYLVEVDERWRSEAEPILPHQLKAGISPEQVEKLPQEFRIMALSQGLQPDTYEIRSEGDLDLGTGFLSPEEVKALFRALPIEITYANKDDRIRFFTESVFHQRFVRAKTIIGRRLEYCHPPRLEGAVRKVVDEIKMGKADYREFWTRIGDRIVRVLIVGVKNEEGELLGTVEIVEDFTDVVNNPEEIRKKIIVL
ncbi:MAG: DUF438 domain-containing protein [Nitrososphaerota archaeon]